MKKFLIGLMVAGGLVTAAQAQETLFYTTTDQQIYRVGTATRSFNNGPVITSWIKKVNMYENRYTMDLVQVHCPTGMYQLLKYAVYVNGGHLTASSETPSGWLHAVPNTLGDGLKQLCQ